MDGIINIGLDAGSTTIKVVATDNNHEIIYKDYRRHFADITGAGLEMLGCLKSEFSNRRVRFLITGSAGMGISERLNLPFLQEVVASSRLALIKFPDIKTLVDIGGEDAKMIFFRKGKMPDMRMNGSCAGGTGSFIDQMASLLAKNVSELNMLALDATTIYPIASRCGVFSRTDIQNLLSRNVSLEDIAASVFHAVSMQVITTLSRGCGLEPPVLLCGGPFAHIPVLKQIFSKVAGLKENQVVLPDNPELIPAWGAAIAASSKGVENSVPGIISIFSQTCRTKQHRESHPLKPLFRDETGFVRWNREKKKNQLPRIELNQAYTGRCYLGIDSGSTATKIILLDNRGKMIFNFYEKNQGTPLITVTKGLQKLEKKAEEAGKKVVVAGSCVTGYGEDLIKDAFNLNYGLVETVAHYTAAVTINPQISFILDIGGQDMKAVFVENHSIARIEINEACSSGCGSFIETFAHTLNHSAASFAGLACRSDAPCDLGTRCTVFMNSKVKQSLREGASIGDISAGLGYSVIKNCLNKVLKIKDISELGDHIMVQGGTFRNPAVIRALELETGKEVMITDYPEMMGAYGAALHARKKQLNRKDDPVDLAGLVKASGHIQKSCICKGCENQCTVTRFEMKNGKHHYAGNKCEKIFSNGGKKNRIAENICRKKYNLLFEHRNNPEPEHGNPENFDHGNNGNPVVNNHQKKHALTIGIPRALGIYEDYPFWHALFTSCGIKVVLSGASTMKMYEKGIGTVMSDNICFPAKLANGHVIDLAEKGVDRIFMPFVVYEDKEDEQYSNSYNCPIVTGYSEVIRSAINPAHKYAVQFDAPCFTLNDKSLARKSCTEYLKSILPDISVRKIRHAFDKALEAQAGYQKLVAGYCREVTDRAIRENRLVILLAGHPYHTDPLIQHKIADMIAGFGVDVITENVIHEDKTVTADIQNIMQWAFTNRIIKSAIWASAAPANVHYIQLTSFGCGPDAFFMDEIFRILRRKGKNATFLKIDDINNIGSTRLRIRSLIESLLFNHKSGKENEKPAIHTVPFQKKDRTRKILIPWFADFYSPFLPPLFNLAGLKAENLPPSDELSAEYGLKYSNNEICYPATLVVGDFMKALSEGSCNHDEIALGITQTGGQCRATNYITLLKEAMVAAGFSNIPVISVSIGGGTINSQPGFKINWRKLSGTVITCLAYADCLSRMYYSTAPREVVKGAAGKLKRKYIDLGIRTLIDNEPEQLYILAWQAAREFKEINNLKPLPSIGIVGEIYVKYNNYGNKNIINWLIDHGLEPHVPALSDFFTDAFPNYRARVSGKICKRSIPGPVMKLAEKYMYGIIRKMESKVSSFPYHHPVGNPHEDAAKASKIINLNAQFGEGWRIPAEFACFASRGINNVVSLQPFGCIANHIVSKGIEKRVRQLFPSMNILFIDFDNGMSEANIFNRLHFLVENAMSEAHAGLES